MTLRRDSLAGQRPLDRLRLHLRTLAHVGGEVKLDVEGPVTQRSILDALGAMAGGS